MRSGSTRTNVAYTWPRTLRTEHPFGKMVYLDLNHWIELAKALSGHQEGRKNLNTLTTFEQAVADEAVVFPLSFTTLLEISKIRNRRQRRNLREVIELLSRYYVATSLSIVECHEVEALLDNTVGVNPKPIGFNDYLDWGVLRAVGMNGRLRIRDKSGEDVTRQFRKSLPPERAKFFDECVANAYVEMNRQLIESAGPDFGEQAKGSTFQLVEGNALFEEELVGLLNQNPRWRRGRIRDVVAARHMAHEIDEILFKGLAERRVPFERLAPDIEGVRRVCDSMPSFDVTVTLKTEYHRNPNHSWTPNDVCDIQALASTLPYCDVVVTDKAVATVVARTGLADRLNTVVLRTLDDVIAYL